MTADCFELIDVAVAEVVFKETPVRIQLTKPGRTKILCINFSFLEFQYDIILSISNINPNTSVFR